MKRLAWYETAVAVVGESFVMMGKTVVVVWVSLVLCWQGVAVVVWLLWLWWGLLLVTLCV